MADRTRRVLVATFDLQAENVALRKRYPRGLATRESRVRFFSRISLQRETTCLRANSRKDARRRVRFAGCERKTFRHTRSEDSIGVLVAVHNAVCVIRVSDVSMIDRRHAKKGDVVLEKNEEH